VEKGDWTMKKPRRINAAGLAGFTLVGCLSWAVSMHADAVSDWNAIAVDTLNTAGTHPGATGTLDIATVQAAVYDAVQAIERRYKPYP
jgi:hypothetical protein